MDNQKITFKQINDYLKELNLKPGLSECFYSMLNEDVIYNPGIIKPKVELASLYKLRLNLNKGNKNSKLSSDEIDSWENAISKLEKSDATTLNLNIIETEDKSYLLFWNLNRLELIAYFWLSNKQTISESETENEKMIKNSYSINSVKYSKGNRIKNWDRKK